MKSSIIEILKEDGIQDDLIQSLIHDIPKGWERYDDFILLPENGSSFLFLLFFLFSFFLFSFFFFLFSFFLKNCYFQAFESSTWRGYENKLWKAVANCFGVTRVAKKERILKDDPMRKSRVVILFGDKTWVSTTDNGNEHLFTCSLQINQKKNKKKTQYCKRCQI